MIALLLVISLLMPAYSYAACPDYSTSQDVPSFKMPKKRSFRKFGSRVLSWLYDPWHMVHDLIIAEGQAAVIEGKFDYDAVLHKDLEGEYIKVYMTGPGTSGWEYIGRYKTNRDGKIRANLGYRSVGEYQVRMVVEGDLSVAIGYLSVVERNRKAILFDIDGTLTRSDFEAVFDYAGIRSARAYPLAIEMVNAYRQKGYQILYLTGRPYWITRDSRRWFNTVGLLDYHYHSNPYSRGPIPPDTQEYKTNYIRYLTQDVGLDIIRAYGNADTDVLAYEIAGLPKHQTYIIGEHAGDRGTQAITENGYQSHFGDVVVPTQPSASCN